jgi:hypothetical protein
MRTVIVALAIAAVGCEYSYYSRDGLYKPGEVVEDQSHKLTLSDVRAGVRSNGEQLIVSAEQERADTIRFYFALDRSTRDMRCGTMQLVTPTGTVNMHDVIDATSPPMSIGTTTILGLAPVATDAAPISIRWCDMQVQLDRRQSANVREFIARSASHGAGS